MSCSLLRQGSQLCLSFESRNDLRRIEFLANWELTTNEAHDG